MKDWAKSILFVLGILALVVFLIEGIRWRVEKDLNPWCMAKGFSHGVYQSGYGGGSFCVRANGEMVRVEGP